MDGDIILEEPVDDGAEEEEVEVSKQAGSLRRRLTMALYLGLPGSLQQKSKMDTFNTVK